MLWRGKHDILDDHDRNIEVASIDNGFGKMFSEVVISTIKKKIITLCRTKVVSNSKHFLKKDVVMKKMFYKFNHHGKLGDSPNVPEGLQVNTCVIRLSLYWFQLNDTCFNVLHIC